jgi:AcrR family transcriptional regulator
MNDVTTLPRGRPRDQEIDRRVIDATREILAEEGFAATTIQAVSRRSEVRPASIYRRWPSRIEMIEEAIFPGFDRLDVEPSGDLKADLERFVDAYKATFSSPVALAALPALIAEYHATASPRASAERAWRSARPLFRAILDAAPAGACDSSLDPDDLFDLLVGSIFYKIHSVSLGGRVGAPDNTVELVLRAMRP